ncbi:hypothetical protein QJS10_CPB11g01426 [Acorus calamus]|uniref:Reverse transcriptase domain-containing protein n=1 Tax=Acorus calamus TaxID=4465 RepID=A0AAV9DT48_ACOCL|nr:hypothetical protein QJS10_CPB11g01426 [Acorus calamus]
MPAPPDRGKGLLPLPSSETPLPFVPSSEAISPMVFHTKPSSSSTLPLKELADFPPLPSSKSSTVPSLYVAAPKVAQVKGILPSPASSKAGKDGPRPRKQCINVPLPTVCEEEKTWSSFFKALASKRPSTSIDYYVPTIDGPQKIAVLEEEEVAEAEAAWGNILIGYIWGKTPVFTPFLQFIKRLWRPKGELTLSLQGNGFFMVRFDLEEDLSHVLEDGPWSMDNRPFVIQRWNRNIRLERERLNSIPLWIKFPNLPLHFWSPTCIGKIASLIGSPLYLDSPTAMRTRSAYARVCIEVEAGSELPDEVFVEIRNGDREAIKVTYDWKPKACTHCPRPFKYFNAWETHHSFEEVIKKSWNQPFCGTPMYILAKKLHHLKVVLKDWNKEIFGPIQDQLQQCKQKLERAQLKVLQFPQNLSFIREEASIKEDYLSFLHREELLLRQKSRQVWLKEGDRNTKYFYSSIKARASHNTIRKVKLENGEFSSDPSEVFWHIVKDDFTKAVSSFFQTGYLLKQLNHTFLSLVPKSKDADSLEAFRPISLCNVTYKTITKILADRMQLVLPKVILPHQSAFIKGRNIVHSTLLAHELVRYMNTQSVKGKACIKVDLRKAFDSVSWTYLEEVGSSKIHAVSWDRVCLPKIEGGLGVMRVFDWNSASMGVRFWEIASNSHSLWASWMRKRYLKQGKNIWTAAIPSGGSSVWKKILSSSSWLRSQTKFIIFEGSSINLWDDPWLKGHDLKYHFQGQISLSWGPPLLSTVHSLIQDGHWQKPSRWPREFDAIWDEISQLEVGGQGSDILIWTGHKTGTSSLASALSKALE